MVSEEEIDKFVEEELKKDLTQEDKIDEEDLENKLGEMGFLWARVSEKLKKDGICFECKKQVDFSGGNVRVLEATKVDAGVCAFVSVCSNCSQKIDDKKIEDAKEEKGGEING